MRRICKTCGKVQDPTTREEEIIQRAIGWSGQVRKATLTVVPISTVAAIKAELVFTN